MNQNLANKISRFEGFLAQDPENIQLIIEYGDLLHQSGQFDKAEDIYRSGLEKDPANEILAGRLGAVYLSKNQFAEAEQQFRSILNDEDAAPALLHNLGLALYYQHKFTEAESVFRQALSKAAEQSNSLAYLVYSLHHQGKLIEAVEQAKQWIRVSQEDRAKAYLALLEFDIGNMTNALDLAREAQKSIPDNPHINLVLGTSALETQEMDQAANFFESVLRSNPNSGRAYMGLGLAELYRQRHELALQYLDKASALMPSNPGVVVTAGWTKLVMQDLQGAEQTFQRALQIDRNFSEAHGGMAVIQALQGHVDAAQQSIKTARRLDPRSFGAVYAQSILWKRKGQDKRAVKLIAEVLETSPREGGLTLVQSLERFIRMSHTEQ